MERTRTMGRPYLALGGAESAVILAAAPLSPTPPVSHAFMFSNEKSPLALVIFRNTTLQPGQAISIFHCRVHSELHHKERLRCIHRRQIYSSSTNSSHWMHSTQTAGASWTPCRDPTFPYPTRQRYTSGHSNRHHPQRNQIHGRWLGHGS